MLLVLWCSLFDDCRSLYVAVCGLLCVEAARCLLLFVVCRLLVIACCLLFGVLLLLVTYCLLWSVAWCCCCVLCGVCDASVSAVGCC